MKQSQCNAGGRHCARMRGVWQPVITVIPAPDTDAKFRGTLKQFVEQCCVVEAGRAADAGEVYRVYERWAAAGGKRSVMKQKNFEACMILAGVRIEMGRPGGENSWTGIAPKHSPPVNPVN